MDKKYTVLIIDDKVENLQYLNSILKEEKYFVKATTDVEFAILSVNIEIPDLILLDIKMPLKDGYTVCKIFKENEKTKDIPIIFISALNDIESKIKAFKEGGVDYITKPFDKEEVKARVKTQLHLYHSKSMVEQLLKQQDFFLKKIIHEMNTPLSIISLNIDNLESNIGPKEQFETIKASTKTLSSIYNDLYFLTKKQQREENIVSINLLKLLSNRVIFFDEMANIKNIDIELHIENEFTINMDIYSLERVIDNTLSNAIKYSHKNSHIDIILGKDKTNHYLSIKDNGIGIENPNNIFEAYYQQKDENIGLGLGLNIVKNICNRNNIQIKLESNSKGSSFTYIFDKKVIG